MSPKLRVWLVTLAFVSALPAFALHSSGLQEEDSHQGQRVIFTPPGETISGTPATLTFLAVDEDGEAMGDSLIGIQITQPEYDAHVLKGDLYTPDGVAMVTFNFQDSGTYVIEAILKDKTGTPISTVENFTIHSKSAGASKTAQLKGWLLLMGVLILGIMVGMGSTRARNVTE